MRAIEDEEPDKLFDDPLARVLAGDKAMKRVYQLLEVPEIGLVRPWRMLILCCLVRLDSSMCCQGEHL